MGLMYIDRDGNTKNMADINPIRVLQVLSGAYTEGCANLITKNIEKLEEFGNEFNFAI